MTSTRRLLSLALAGALVTSAHAAISVTSTGTSTVVDNGSTTATYSAFDLNGGNTVVLFFSGENVNGLTSASFGAEPMTIVQATGSDTARDHLSAIAYIINPAVSVGSIGLEWTSDGGSESVHTPIGLEKVDSVADSDFLSGNLSFNYTTTIDGGYVVGNATNNDFNGPPGQPTVSSSNLDTYEFNGSASGNFGTIHVHGGIGTADSYTDTFSGANSSVGIAFEAVPEPSAALLGGLGALLLLRRRRAA